MQFHQMVIEKLSQTLVHKRPSDHHDHSLDRIAIIKKHSPHSFFNEYHSFLQIAPFVRGKSKFPHSINMEGYCKQCIISPQTHENENNMHKVRNICVRESTGQNDGCAKLGDIPSRAHFETIFNKINSHKKNITYQFLNFQQFVLCFVFRGVKYTA